MVFGFKNNSEDWEEEEIKVWVIRGFKGFLKSFSFQICSDIVPISIWSYFNANSFKPFP
jgi:hypothetical protein